MRVEEIDVLTHAVELFQRLALSDDGVTKGEIDGIIDDLQRQLVKKRQKPRHCSFCNRTKSDCGSLVEGVSGAYICSDCVEVCRELLQENGELCIRLPSDFDFRSEMYRILSSIQQAQGALEQCTDIMGVAQARLKAAEDREK